MHMTQLISITQSNFFSPVEDIDEYFKMTKPLLNKKINCNQKIIKKKLTYLLNWGEFMAPKNDNRLENGTCKKCDGKIKSRIWPEYTLLHNYY